MSNVPFCRPICAAHRAGDRRHTHTHTHSKEDVQHFRPVFSLVASRLRMSPDISILTETDDPSLVIAG